MDGIVMLVLTVLSWGTFRQILHKDFSNEGIHIPARFWGERVLSWDEVEYVKGLRFCLEIRIHNLSYLFYEYEYRNWDAIVSHICEKVPADKITIPEGWEATLR